MPVPTSINDLSATAASNSPAGGDSIGNTADDFLRAIQAIVKEGCGTIYTAGGTGNALTVTTTPTTTSYTTGQRWLVKASATNSGSATLNVNGLGAKTLKKSGGAAMASGDLVSGDIYLMVYDGTDVRVVGSLGQYAITLGGALTTAGAFTTSGAAITLTATGSTNVTLPTSGTLATTGANTFSGDQNLNSNDITNCKTIEFVPGAAVNTSGSDWTFALTSGNLQTLAISNGGTYNIKLNESSAPTGVYHLLIEANYNTAGQFGTVNFPSSDWSPGAWHGRTSSPTLDSTNFIAAGTYYPRACVTLYRPTGGVTQYSIEVTNVSDSTI